MQNSTSTTPWLRSTEWDAFWIMSGMWALIPIAAASFVPAALNGMVVAAVLTMWLAHRIGTAYLAYTTPEYAALLRVQYGRFVVLPAVVLSLFALFFFDPLSVLPLSHDDKAKLALTAYFFVNSVHFAFQHYGVLRIYAMRSNQDATDDVKRVDRWFCVLVTGVVVTAGLLLRGSLVLDATTLPLYWTTADATKALAVARFAGPALSTLLTMAMLLKEATSSPPSLPKCIYIASIGVQGVLVFFINPVAFFLLWSLQHWLVAIGLTTRMANASAADCAERPWYRLWRSVNARRWRALLVLMVVSVVLAPLFIAASNPEKLAHLGASLLRHDSIAKLILTLSVGSAFVHLIIDRAVFRFSNAAVRKVGLVLLFR